MTDPVVHPAPKRLKAVGWTIAFLLLGFVIMFGLASGLFLLAGQSPDPSHPTPFLLVAQTAAGLVGFGLSTWLIGVRVLKLTWADLRYRPVQGAGKGFGLGVLVGVLPASAAILLSLPLGHARFVPDSGGPGLYLQQVALTALLLAPAALLEEMIFRGVGQVVLAKAFGRLPALLALSILFACAHLLNPNTTPLGITNIALAGVFLGLVFYTPGGIWTAWGAHLGWNATLAALDAPVSGLPFEIPWINYLPGEPAWLTGGSFGPEGGLLASVAIVAMSLAIWSRARKETA